MIAFEASMKPLIALAFLVITVYGQTAPPNRPETATIHVYRPKAKIKGAMVKPSIYFDGMELYRLSQGTFFNAKVTAGKHLITAGRSEVGQFVELEPGKDYYFMMGHKNIWTTGFSGAQPFTLEPVSEDQAKTQMRGLKELPENQAQKCEAGAGQ